MTFRLEDHTEPLDPVQLPRGGRTLPAREFNLAMQKLAKRAEQGDDEAGRELLRRCLPGITDDEIDDLTPHEMILIGGHCSRALVETLAYLKNGAGAAGPGPTTSPSAPTMNSSTPSPASPARSGRTGGRSRRSRSTASSTPSIG